MEHNAQNAQRTTHNGKRITQISTRRASRGYFVILTLVFSAVFFTLLSALSGYIFVQKKLQLAKENREKALHLAEAGLDYYKWFLAHNPGDVTDGTGLPGPYVHQVSDPEAGTAGTFSLDIQPETFCGVVSSIRLTSRGATKADPSATRTVAASYVRPSVAAYSHIVDANVWAGADRTINGPYHSNQGVRMDAKHNAKVTSGLLSWLCTGTFGCSPSKTQNGVFGAGTPGAPLWEFPVPPVDFNGLTVNLNEIKTFAQASGIYLPPTGSYGYRITFRADGVAEIRKVVGTTQVWGYTVEGGWQKERTVMSNTQAPADYVVPAGCPVIFAEDDVWVEGVVSGKALVAAADLSENSIDRSVIINGDLTYTDGVDDGITVIGEKDVLIGLQVPDTMNIYGIFMAQKGKFGRNHYCENDCSAQSGNQGLPATLDQYVKRSVLNTTGSVISKNRVGTKWTAGGVFVSGFNQRNDSFDQDLSISPPPFTPWTSNDYMLASWKEL